MTTDKNTLYLARQWAADVNADRQTLSQDTIDAAADLISSLPDAWVDAEKLREVVADHHIDMSEELMEALGALLPAPPPPTMAEIEWDDAEHHLAEALFGDTRKVVMLARDADEEGDWSGLIHCRMEDGSIDLIEKEFLTPTGRKYRLEPSESVPKGGPIETVFDPAYIYIDSGGDEWEHLCGRWLTGATHAERVAGRKVRPGLDSLPAEYGPYTRIEA